MVSLTARATVIGVSSWKPRLKSDLVRKMHFIKLLSLPVPRGIPPLHNVARRALLPVTQGVRTRALAARNATGARETSVHETETSGNTSIRIAAIRFWQKDVHWKEIR